jgi:hypothetical protein
VRSTVRAARTAANAKAAADSAAFVAQSACEGAFGSIDEARAAQTRSSIAQSHAIHAAVVEHEANTAKRRAALALAHDVKCWNVHRKRELLRSCLAYAKSQHVATRRAVDAWSCLRDGYLGSSLVPESRMSAPEPPVAEITERRPNFSVPAAEEDPVAQIYSDAATGIDSDFEIPSIEAVDHYILSAPVIAPVILEETKNSDEQSKPLTAIEEEEHVPIVDADPVSTIVEGITPLSSQVEEGEAENVLSASMQSLVDGLMSWGGQYDSEDDLNLPVGMATSIVLEGSGIAGVN